MEPARARQRAPRQVPALVAQELAAAPGPAAAVQLARAPVAVTREQARAAEAAAEPEQVAPEAVAPGPAVQPLVAAEQELAVEPEPEVAARLARVPVRAEAAVPVLARVPAAVEAAVSSHRWPRS